MSFATSLLLAVKFSPFYLGVWGAFLLIRRYFQLVNLGIPDSSSVLIVQNFKSDEIIIKIETNALFISFLLGVVSYVLLYLLHFLNWDFFSKYQLENKLWIIGCVVLLTYINDVLFKIFRAKGRVFQLTFYHSIIQILLFIGIFTSQNAALIWVLMSIYLIGLLSAFIVFIFSKAITFNFEYISYTVIKKILSKGFFLFIYNISFYFIMLSTRTFISSYYSVSDFGLFTFSYTLSNSVIVLLDALSSLLMPKMLSKFGALGKENLLNALVIVKENYIFLSFLITFSIIAVLPWALKLFPSYVSTFSTICYLSIASSCFASSFGLTTYLIAQNKEKTLAFISFISLLVNLGLCFLVSYFIKGNYEYICVVIIFVYLMYTYLCYAFTKSVSNINFNFFNNCLSFKIIILIVLGLIISFLKIKIISSFPLLLFIFLNFSSFKNLYQTFLKLFYHPDIINIKK